MAKVRSNSSRRSVPVMRLQVAFARGGAGGFLSTRVPVSAGAASRSMVNCPPRFRIVSLAVSVRSPRFIRSLRAAWVVHALSGLAVVPGRCARLMSCSVRISAWMRLGRTVSVWMKSVARVPGWSGTGSGSGLRAAVMGLCLQCGGFARRWRRRLGGPAAAVRRGLAGVPRWDFRWPCEWPAF